jgi:hypothetical protein
MNRRIAAAAALLVIAGTAFAQAPRTLEVVAFGGGGNWVFWRRRRKACSRRTGSR